MSVRSLRYNTIEQHFTKGVTASTDRDALAFLEAAQIYNANQQRAIVNLVRSLKRVGLWSKMKAIYPFVGGTATSHMYNLKDPRNADAAFRLTFSGGWTHNANGVTSNGTNAFADTFLIPTTNLTENSTHHSNYSRTDGTSGCDIGGMSSTGYFWHLNRYSEPGYENICLSYMYRTAQIEASNTNGTGYYVATRTGLNDFRVIKNNTQIGSNTASTSGWTTTNRKLYVGARNNQGTADAYSNRNLAFVTIGDGLTDTDATNLYNIVDLYQRRLGRNV